MRTDLEPREGVSLFIAGHTPGWGLLEFKYNGKVIEGVRAVDIAGGIGQVYARDAHGNWPVFTPAGKPLLYELQGAWSVTQHYPPDTEFEDPGYIERKRAAQRKRNDKRKETRAAKRVRA